ncbi:MAG: putative metal-binding motif-containing protein [Myxococcota bacterium]
MLGLLLLLSGGCAIHWEPDSDGDGFPDRRDCLPLDADTHPEATERCDGMDNDCDGQIDDADLDQLPDNARPFYRDADLDGAGDPSTSVLACVCPGGYVFNNADCSDDDAQRHPGAAELCDELDNNCDGLSDDADEDSPPIDASPWYRDADQDGYGTGLDVVLACQQPPGYVSLHSSLLDCADTDPTVYPGAYEICDHMDNDCDGEIDDDTAQATLWYPDIDQDLHGDSQQYTQACPGPEGWVTSGDDCQDVWHRHLLGESFPYPRQ